MLHVESTFSRTVHATGRRVGIDGGAVIGSPTPVEAADDTLGVWTGLGGMLDGKDPGAVGVARTSPTLVQNPSSARTVE
jgi:hypothetical protein